MVTQISANDLAAKLDSEESFTLIDTRPEDSYEGWRIHGATNVPFGPEDELSDDRLEHIGAENGDSIVAICGKGLTSTPFAFELQQRGYDDVSVVKGGMEDWSKVYEVVPLETERDDLVVIQLQRRAKGCLGYVVGSASSGRAVVVDPTRQTDRFKIAAADAGLTIERVLDTHIHADHISGGRQLADELDVPYHLGEHAAERDVEYVFEPLADGETIEVGEIEIEALHAPGHTSDMVNYLVDGEALLTGDTLFVESVGRTELQFGDSEAHSASDEQSGETAIPADASKGAELLYETLHETILELPDETRICPGHVSVSEENRYGVGSPGDPIAERLGTLRSDLELLGLDEDEFVARLTENAPDKPPNYERVIEINSGRDPVDDESEATELELGPNNCAA
ncbi:MBL fold metallo-hydrolase [Natronolimnohabitans innermongolicus]|uniref:Rhodanese-like protein n=1 Tax=Natronolimnohabitans innermongolicus JCM 12255 TaxID=1227499 RepID=L9WH39_9EURY|nr:MBL fold metallo-hydrolase [Natronolimnohabitans innermongolicus]ELY48546.1 Rhodanese-like protein [Natronolimnohabitans innermongolicus JCM 12255]